MAEPEFVKYRLKWDAQKQTGVYQGYRLMDSEWVDLEEPFQPIKIVMVEGGLTAVLFFSDGGIWEMSTDAVPVNAVIPPRQLNAPPEPGQGYEEEADAKALAKLRGPDWFPYKLPDGTWDVVRKDPTPQLAGYKNEAAAWAAAKARGSDWVAYPLPDGSWQIAQKIAEPKGVGWANRADADALAEERGPDWFAYKRPDESWDILQRDPTPQLEGWKDKADADALAEERGPDWFSYMLPDGSYTVGQRTPQANERVVRGEAVGGEPGSFFIQDAQGNLRPYTTPQKSIDQMLAAALDGGDWDKAQSLWEFINQPTSQERLQAALQYAASPGDYMTIIGMARGELPIQAQPGTYQRVAPPADFLQQAARGFFEPAQPAAGFGAPAQPTFGGLTGEAASRAAATFGQAGGALPPPTSQGFVGGAALKAGQAARAAAAQQAQTPPLSPTSRWAQPAPPQMRFEAVAPDTGEKVIISKEEIPGFDEAGFDITGPFPLLDTVWLTNSAGELVGVPEETVEQALAVGYRRLPFGMSKERYQAMPAPMSTADAIKQAQGMPYQTQAGTMFVPTAMWGQELAVQPQPAAQSQALTFQPAGQPALGPSFLPRSIQQVGLRGEALPRVRRQLPAMGALTFPSAQAWSRFMPLERGMFQRAVELQGAPWEDYWAQRQGAMPGWGRQGPFRRAPLRLAGS